MIAIKELAAIERVHHMTICRNLPRLLACILVGVITVHPVDADTTFNPLGQEIQTINLPEAAAALSWSPDQRLLAIVNHARNQAYLVETQNGRVLWAARKTGGDVITFDATGQFVIVPPIVMHSNTFGENLDVIASVISIADTNNIRNLSDGKPGRQGNTASDLDLSGDGALLAAVAPGDDRIVLFDTSDWSVAAAVGPIRIIKDMGQQIRPKLAVVNAGSGTVTIALWDGQIQTWDFRKKKMLTTFRAFNAGVSFMVQNAVTDAVVVSGVTSTFADAEYSKDFKPGTKLKWALDPKSGMPVYNAPGMTTVIRRDDPLTLIQAWNGVTGAHLATYAGPDGSVLGLAVSPDGRYVSATKLIAEGTIGLFLWDATMGNLLGRREYNITSNLDRWGGAIAFTPDGRRLAVVAGAVAHILSIVQ